MMFDLIPFDKGERRLFNQLFNDEFFNSFGSIRGFHTDIVDKGDKFVLEAELPGFDKEDIHIDLEGDYLTIRAERAEENRDENDRFVRKERRYGSFSRSFNVSDIKVDDISAAYKHGVLRLELPKALPSQPKSRKIDIQ